jgi:hypothetical protein
LEARDRELSGIDQPLPLRAPGNQASHPERELVIAGLFARHAKPSARDATKDALASGNAPS